MADICNRSGKYFHAVNDDRTYEMVEKVAQSAQM
jgi:hypothetical protein